MLLFLIQHLQHIHTYMGFGWLFQLKSSLVYLTMYQWHSVTMYIDLNLNQTLYFFGHKCTYICNCTKVCVIANALGLLFLICSFFFKNLHFRIFPSVNYTRNKVEAGKTEDLETGGCYWVPGKRWGVLTLRVAVGLRYQQYLIGFSSGKLALGILV